MNTIRKGYAENDFEFPENSSSIVLLLFKRSALHSPLLSIFMLLLKKTESFVFAKLQLCEYKTLGFEILIND